MIEYIKALIGSDDSQFIIFGIIVSVMGGMANWLLSDQHTFFRFFAAIFLAGFAGFLVGELCLAANIEGGWAFFICGSAGLSGEAVLKLSRKYVIKKVSFITGQPYRDYREYNKDNTTQDSSKKNSVKKKNDQIFDEIVVEIEDNGTSADQKNKENKKSKETREKYLFRKALKKSNTLGSFIDDTKEKE